MIRKSALLLLPVLAGCLGTSPSVSTTYWTVSCVASSAPRLPLKYGTARLLQFSVRAPYDVRNVVVARPDGSVAFDPCNQYAASPAALLKGAAADVLEASGLFARVVPQNSTCRAEVSLEITVRRLALDAVGEKGLAAAVEIAVACLDARTGAPVSVASGTASAEVGGRAFSAAFSSAFTAALVQALAKL